MPFLSATLFQNFKSVGKAFLIIRTAEETDSDVLWSILEPVIRAGETYTLPLDMSQEAALAYWFGQGHEVFVAEENGLVVGTYFLQPNQRGGGAHVANCGYVTAQQASGKGVARLMCQDSLDRARAKGFLAMQFNFVVSSNERAIALWEKFEFKIVGRLPDAFRHPRLGLVDALVMYRKL